MDLFESKPVLSQENNSGEAGVSPPNPAPSLRPSQTDGRDVDATDQEESEASAGTKLPVSPPSQGNEDSNASVDKPAMPASNSAPNDSKETNSVENDLKENEERPGKSKSDAVSRLTPEQIAFRQKKKNDYAANEFEGWPLHQLFVDYPQLFLGIATVSVFVFLLILQVHFLISLVLAIATPFGVIKLWRENPKALLITVYSFAGVIVLASAILIYTAANAEEVPRTR